jgi:chemotaxis protein MotB
MLLVDSYGLDAKQISVAGYSQYRPVASNQTAEGRRVNRRVDLVVVSKTSRTKNAVAQVGPTANGGN